MNPEATGKRLLSALLLAVMICLPCMALALGDYDDDAMDEYCYAWTAEYENGPYYVKLDATLSIISWAHGRYDMYSNGQRHSVAQMLTSNESPATYFVEAEASFDDSEYTIMMIDEYLTEEPYGLSISANGRTLTGSHSIGSSNSDFHYFRFNANDMIEVIDYLLGGGTATFNISSNKGASSVQVSKYATPKLVLMMEHTINGRLYSKTTSSRYLDHRLLPSGPIATPTPKPTPRSNVPTSLQGVTLWEGDSGNRVRLVKLRMQELGYYRATASMDENFNNMMVDRLKQFQRNNGLVQSGIVDSSTLEKLYSSNPVKGEFYVAPTPTPKPEGRIMLVIPSGGNGQWKELSGDRMQMRVEVTNESRYRTVEAFELYIYTENVWGDRDPEEGTVYTVTTVKDVRPGKTVYSDYFTLPNRSEIDRVYVGVKKMRYDDGTTEEVYDVDYFYWVF